MDTKIKIPITVASREVFSGRRGKKVYDAKLGRLEASAPTAKEAASAVTDYVVALAEDIAAPLILIGYDGSIWCCYRDSWGWGYAIHRPAGDHMPLGATRAGCIAGGYSRADAEDHMRRHWYDQNAAGIVRGILGLCSDWREWRCPACSCVSQARPDADGAYVCQSPACGCGVSISPCGDPQ